MQILSTDVSFDGHSKNHCAVDVFTVELFLSSLKTAATLFQEGIYFICMLKPCETMCNLMGHNTNKGWPRAMNKTLVFAIQNGTLC